VGAKRYALFNRDVFVDPQTDKALHLAQVHSHPIWLVQRWMGCFGGETTERILRADNEWPIHGIRANPLRPLPGGLAAYLEENGLDVEPGQEPGLLRVSSVGRAVRLPGFAQGSYTVQDETAVGAARLAAIQEGDSVLDLCAAPGGKSGAVHLGAGAEGLVVGMDLSVRRLCEMRRGMERMGFDIPLICADGKTPPFGPRRFDVVIVDAPCSNTGVLGRRPEVRWRLTPGRLSSLIAEQKALLHAAARLTRRSILYSTCSIEREENQEIVRSFTSQCPAFHVTAERFALPRRSDGGYAARLERREG